MKISQTGIDLIKSFESYKTELPGGGCTAYLCPAGVPTIGWGCTKGVKIGDVWTREQAEEGLRHELGKAEAAVMRLVSVDMTQGQFDALVSFTYNCGDGALARSSVLSHLNAGRADKAAQGFALWNKARVKGKLTELRGLTRRRAAEKALFLTHEDEAEMPQKIEPPSEGNGKAAVITASTSVGANFLAGDPVGMTSALVAVKGNVGQLASGVNLALWGVPIALGAVAVGFVLWAMRGQNG